MTIASWKGSNMHMICTAKTASRNYSPQRKRSCVLVFYWFVFFGFVPFGRLFDVSNISFSSFRRREYHFVAAFIAREKQPLSRYRRMERLKESSPEPTSVVTAWALSSLLHTITGGTLLSRLERLLVFSRTTLSALDCPKSISWHFSRQESFRGLRKTSRAFCFGGLGLSCQRIAWTWTRRCFSPKLSPTFTSDINY